MFVTLLIVLSLVPVSADATIEEVTIVANRDQRGVMHSLSVQDTVVVDDSISHVRTIADLISGIAGVELNGQGGSLQTYSVRGVSRSRVQTRLGPALLSTDRRAGNSASFLDPWLLSSVTVVKGPLATLYGSGSIGGLVSIQPKTFSEGVVHGSLFSNGFDQKVGLGFGNGPLSIGAVYQKNQRSEDPEGNELNDQKENFGISLQLRSREKDSTLQLIVTQGSNLGKSNADFPDRRITNYPEERHALVSWQKGWEDWDTSLYLHDRSLRTEISSLDEVSFLTSESFDYGVLVQRFWQAGAFDLRTALDINGRAGVDGHENRINRETGQTIQQQNLDGRQFTSAFLTDLQWRKGNLTLRTGLRWSNVNQEDRQRSETNSNVIGFIGAGYSINNWELYTQAGNGFRFPGLTEKFFTGTTSRGSVLGNPNLHPETSNNLEIGMIISVESINFRLAAYTMRLEDYIKRTTIAPRLRTFENTSPVKVSGSELTLSGDHANVSWELMAHYIEGSDQNEYIADIPAPALAFKIQTALAGGYLSAHYKYRLQWDNVNPAEIPVDDAHLLSVRFRRSMNSQIDLAFWVDNVLDETYRLTTDDLSAHGSGIGMGLSITARLD